MSPAFKYAVCIIGGVLVQVAGIIAMFAETFLPHGHRPLPPVYALFFPYIGIPAPFEEGSLFNSLLGVVVLLQGPLYGWLFGRAWVKRRIWPELSLVVVVHIVAAWFGYRALVPQ